MNASELRRQSAAAILCVGAAAGITELDRAMVKGVLDAFIHDLKTTGRAGLQFRGMQMDRQPGGLDAFFREERQFETVYADQERVWQEICLLAEISESSKVVLLSAKKDLPSEWVRISQQVPGLLHVGNVYFAGLQAAA